MLLVRNVNVWRWSSPLAGPSSSDHEVEHKRWISIDSKGKFCIPMDDSFEPNEQEFEVCIDARNQLILPGLMDSHIHVSGTGESVAFLDLKECRSIEQLVSAVERHIAEHADISWIIGVNWDQTKLGRYPTRHDIDPVSGDKRVFLWRACWHIGLANSNAIISCGIDINSEPDTVQGGVIDFDGISVTGVFRERAVEIVIKAVADKTKEEKISFIQTGLSMCLKYGLTSVQTNDENAVDLYNELLRSNSLPIRVFLTPLYEDFFSKPSEGVDTTRKPNFIEPMRSGALRTGEVGGDVSTPDSRLTIERLKIFSDGSLGAETAAMRLIDDDSAGQSAAHEGVLVHERLAMQEMISSAKNNGYRLEIHAIGDAAAEQVLTSLRDAGITAADRAILTHCQVLGPDLFELMHSLGVIANIQPSFVPTDMEWASARLSPKVFEYSYAWRSLMRSGIWCAGGSDAPIETCSPWVGIYDAMFRSRRGANNGDVLNAIASDIFRPEERLSFADALWIYTVGGAFASKTEHVLGRIENGYGADFVLVDPRITRAGDDIACARILQNYKPEMVVVGGEVVAVSSEWKSAVSVKISNYNLSRHRGLLAATEAISDSVSSAAKLEGPYVPGKNGSIGLEFRAVTPSSKINKAKGKAGPSLLCSELPLPADQGTLFNNRPGASCVCLITKFSHRAFCTSAFRVDSINEENDD